MKNLKTFFCLFTSIILCLACEPVNDNVPDRGEKSMSLKKENKNKKHADAFDVRIKLEDRYGHPVGPNGLQGYFAINQKTGEVFYPTRSYDDNVFENLPRATYSFGAYDGYFDGASSSVVTLNDTLIGDDGLIIVTLRYWSE